MINKTIEFDYKGGTYTQNINISGNNLPWKYECEDTWILVDKSTTSITIKVGKIYGFDNRVGYIKITDRFNNELNIEVKQTGYYDLSVECPEEIVLLHNYYDENEFYNVYITVYGGSKQNIDCKRLKPYITKVWDNSNMYNDYILKIPKNLKGNFTIKHSEYNEFKKFCEKNKIEFDSNKLEKKIEIIQVDDADSVGEMVLSYNDKDYSSKNDDVIEIKLTDKPSEIKIKSCKFVRIESKTKCSIIKAKEINISNVPYWINTEVKGNKIIIKSNGTSVSDRNGIIRIENKKNPKQFITVRISE